MRKIVFHDLHVQMRHFLDALQNVQAAAAAVALHRIGRIGHQLQFPQHELRNHQHAVQKAGFGDIGDAAVDNHAGIENLEGLLDDFSPPKMPPSADRLSMSPFLAPTIKPTYVIQQQNENLHKREHRVFVPKRPLQNNGDQDRSNDP